MRFDLDVAERQRQGKDTPEATSTLKIDLTQLEGKDRVLLVNRMERGRDDIFDVCRLQWDGTKEFRRPTLQEGRADFYAIPFPVRIQANEPTLKALVEAIRADFRRYQIR